MISLCIPNYNRSKFVISSFRNVLHDERIDEIIISDDCSEEKIFNELSEELKKIGSEKIKLYRNTINKGAFLNKYESVKKASNEWVILLDSDNIIGVDFLDNLPDERRKDTLYLPCHAVCESPNLDYSEFSDLVIEIDVYKNLVNSNEPKKQCLLNTGNYFFNKDNYIKSVDNEKSIRNPYGVDVFYFIYLWFKLESSNKLKVVKDLKYYHTLHGGDREESSWYTKTAEKSSIELSKIIQLSNGL